MFKHTNTEMNTTMPMPEGVKRFEISTFKPKNDETRFNFFFFLNL